MTNETCYIIKNVGQEEEEERKKNRSKIFFVVVPDKLLARLMAVYEVTIGGGTVRLSPLPPSRFAVSIYTVAALVLQCCCSLAFAAA